MKNQYRAPDAMALCAKCGHEFVYWLPQRTDGFDDVFHKVQQAIGRPVCPTCIEATRVAPPPPEQCPRCHEWVFHNGACPLCADEES